MSDSLLDLQRYFLQNLQMVLPVAGAVILVIAVYFCSFGTPSQPPLLMVTETITTKKEKALAKKKLKQQQQQLQKKQKPSNAPVIEDKPQEVTPVEVKPVAKAPAAKAPAAKAQAAKGLAAKGTAAKVPAKKAVKTQDKKKVLNKPDTNIKDDDPVHVAIRQEKAQMKKEAQKGEWVTVVSTKDKRAKQQQQKEVEVTAEAVAMSEEIKKIIAENEAKTQNSPPPSKEEKKSSNTSKKSKSTKSAVVVEKEAAKPAKSAQKTSAPTPTASKQADVKPQDPKPAAHITTDKGAAGDQPATTAVKASTESDKSIQEKIEEAMQPAFDELGGWEEAKPMKMKNVKKRARREK